MTVKDLKRKLDLLSENAQDFEIHIDAGDVNLLSLEKVYVGGAWNIILSASDEDEDIEDDSTIEIPRKKE